MAVRSTIRGKRRKTPPVNAELTKIEREEGGGTDPGGNPIPLEWVEKWTGSAPAFVATKGAFRYGDQGAFTETVTEISFPAELAAVESGDTRLTYTRGGIEFVVELDAIEDGSDFGFHRGVATNPGT